MDCIYTLGLRKLIFIETSVHLKLTMNLNLLAALDALLRESSVTKAARRMHVSTPAMSHTLARIREATGDPILVRSGRGSVLTAKAEKIRVPLQQLLEQASLLLKPNIENLAQVDRELVICAPHGVTIMFSSMLIGAINSVMPNARIRFLSNSDSSIVGLQEGRVDLEIGAVADRNSDIKTQLLFEQTLVGAARAKHAIFQSPCTLRRYLTERHAAVVERGMSASPIDVGLKSLGLSRVVSLTVPTPYAALMASAQTNLLTAAPSMLTLSVQKNLGLSTFKLPLDIPPEKIFQAWHHRSDFDSAHVWLREYIHRTLSQKAWLDSVKTDLALNE